MPLRASTPPAVALYAQDALGEGPSWDPAAGRLLRVDIAQGLVHCWGPESGATSTLRVGGEVSAAVRRTVGGLILAIGHQLVALDRDGRRTVLATVEPHDEDTRFNDCRCDPQGRLWAGTMSKTRTPDRAALYRLEAGREIEAVVAPTTLSNGIGWSPDGDRMYFIDSTTFRVDVFGFDGATGSIGDRRPFAHVAPADGLPDGLAVDAEGGVWVCLFGGAAIRRYDAGGGLDAELALPATNPTCPAFGGPDLRTLYVTTARHRLSDAQLAAEPAAGSILALRPGVAGLPAQPFAG